MKKKVMLNVGCTMLCQLVTFISGLIVPRLILSTFGSEANGLVSSITQFLNYIALVEGGIGSVVLTALYGPLAKKDDRKISSVLKAAENFFRQIASIFVFYTIALACVYPIVIKSSFSWLYVASLTVILSFTLFIQYFFSIIGILNNLAQLIMKLLTNKNTKDEVTITMGQISVAIVDYIVEHHRSRCFD